MTKRGGPQNLEALAEIEKEPLPAAVHAQVELCRGDANAFLSLGLRFVAEAEQAPAVPGRAAPPAKVMRDVRHRMLCVLAYTLRHLCDPTSPLGMFGSSEGVDLIQWASHLYCTDQTVMLCSPGRDKQRQEMFKAVLTQSGEMAADPLMRAFSAYGAAQIACANGDAAAFSSYLSAAEEGFTAAGNAQMVAAIKRHREGGPEQRVAVEMSRLLDTSEMSFREHTLGSLARMEQARVAQQAQASNGGAAAGNGASASKSGAKLVAGGKGAAGKAAPVKAKEGVAASTAANDAKMKSMARHMDQEAVKVVEAEIQVGYELFQKNQCVPSLMLAVLAPPRSAQTSSLQFVFPQTSPVQGDVRCIASAVLWCQVAWCLCRLDAGLEHFAKVLKKAFELPKTGMSISVIFSASHAYIEGCAQLRRYGKADAIVDKLKELAEYASENPIPFSIETVPQRLHLWWREKRANLLSRQVHLPSSQLQPLTLRRTQ